MRYLIIFFSCFCFAQVIKPVDFNYEKAILGKKIFFEPRISPKNISCQDCHNMIFSLNTTSNSYPKPISIINSAYKYLFFYDGSVFNINEQVKYSILSTKQSSSNPEFIANFIKNSSYYSNEFKKIYNSKFNFSQIIDVIVEFEKSVVGINSKFDLWQQGLAELSDSEQRGKELFITYGCEVCHNGINFGDNLIDLSINNEKIKVPTLRNIIANPTYFKDGNISSIYDAVKIMGIKKLDMNISDDDTEMIVDFIKTLNSEVQIIDEK